MTPLCSGGHETCGTCSSSMRSQVRRAVVAWESREALNKQVDARINFLQPVTFMRASPTDGSFLDGITTAWRYGYALWLELTKTEATLRSSQRPNIWWRVIHIEQKKCVHWLCRYPQLSSLQTTWLSTILSARIYRFNRMRKWGENGMEISAFFSLSISWISYVSVAWSS